MRECAPLHLLVLVVIRHVVVADDVDDRSRRDRGFEYVGLGDKPGAELAAIAGAFDAEAIAIDPGVTAHGCAESIENVLALVAVLIREDCVGKRLAVASGSA